MLHSFSTIFLDNSDTSGDETFERYLASKLTRRQIGNVDLPVEHAMLQQRMKLLSTFTYFPRIRFSACRRGEAVDLIRYLQNRVIFIEATVGCHSTQIPTQGNELKRENPILRSIESGLERSSSR